MQFFSILSKIWRNVSCSSCDIPFNEMFRDSIWHLFICGIIVFTLSVQYKRTLRPSLWFFRLMIYPFLDNFSTILVTLAKSFCDCVTKSPIVWPSFSHKLTKRTHCSGVMSSPYSDIIWYIWRLIIPESLAILWFTILSISILFSLLKAEKHICHIKQMTIFVMTNIEIM